MCTVRAIPNGRLSESAFVGMCPVLTNVWRGRCEIRSIDGGVRAFCRRTIIGHDAPGLAKTAGRILRQRFFCTDVIGIHAMRFVRADPVRRTCKIWSQKIYFWFARHGNKCVGNFSRRDRKHRKCIARVRGGGVRVYSKLFAGYVSRNLQYSKTTIEQEAHCCSFFRTSNIIKQRRTSPDILERTVMFKATLASLISAYFNAGT